MREWQKWKIRKIDGSDPRFPKSLANIKPKIKQLFYRGEWEEKLLTKSVAIVGSRRMTRYGQEVTDKVVMELVGNKVTIISGFMFGVDSQAHRKCVEMGGKTIAVFGGGLEYLMVAENDMLYSQILESGGLVISEYENNFKPTLWSFPQRNRIVSGLTTLGVVVIEAGMKSGSLITAGLARKQGKEVWAVPGPITSSVSAGSNWLIKEGRAKMLLDPGEIVGRQQVAEQELLFEAIDPDQKRAVECLRAESLSIDELALKLKKNVAEIGSMISLLQMRGTVAEEDGKFFMTQGR